MNFRAVDDRCAVHFASLLPSIPEADIITCLSRLKFLVLEVDVVALARSRIGRTRYELGASFNLAPEAVDCSSFTKWVYAKKGAWLPRLSVQQRSQGVGAAEPMSGDLMFAEGQRGLYLTDPSDAVGHVGIFTERGTVIHAASKKAGVIESSIDVFTQGKPRGARRLMRGDVKTVHVPYGHSIETSDDLKWLILKLLP